MARVNEKAPDLIVDQWVQGKPSNIGQERGRVLLIEVIQVNCPGCFMAGIPETIGVYEKFRDRPLAVWILATAFENFDKNNLANLKKLLHTGEVTGETLAALSQANFLQNNRLQYPIPFPVAWDKLVKNEGEPSSEAVRKIIDRDMPDYGSLPPKTREMIAQQIRAYLKQKKYDALTFETYALCGTPSSIIIDKKGILRHKLFGSGQDLEKIIYPLLDE
ncbi:MAG: TlpA family protein disulfide reductase [Nitrospinaceae bacterium]